MARSHHILLLLAFVPLGTVPLISRAAVEPIVEQVTSTLRALLGSIPDMDRGATLVEPSTQEAQHVLQQIPDRVRVDRFPRRLSPIASKAGGGILVRRNAVRAAVKRGIRPSANPVAGTEDRPAGLVVHGWGGTGVGFADGDIITRVGGRTPSSIDDVAIAVAGAYKTKSYVISGQIWRSGRLLAVTVELPFPKNKDKQASARAAQR